MNVSHGVRAVAWAGRVLALAIPLSGMLACGSPPASSPPAVAEQKSAIHTQIVGGREAAGDVPLYALDGSRVSLTNQQPYSPEKSCKTSGCHGDDAASTVKWTDVTLAYHFQQGRARPVLDAAGARTYDAAGVPRWQMYVADPAISVSTKYWLLSDGRYGKW